MEVVVIVVFGQLLLFSLQGESGVPDPVGVPAYAFAAAGGIVIISLSIVVPDHDIRELSIFVLYIHRDPGSSQINERTLRAVPICDRKDGYFDSILCFTK